MPLNKPTSPAAWDELTARVAELERVNALLVGYLLAQAQGLERAAAGYLAVLATSQDITQEDDRAQA